MIESRVKFWVVCSFCGIHDSPTGLLFLSKEAAVCNGCVEDMALRVQLWKQAKSSVVPTDEGRAA